MLARFLEDETGVVTIEWTVMAAAMGTLALAGMSALQIGLSELAPRPAPDSQPIAFHTFDHHAPGWSNPGPGGLGQGRGIGLGPFRADDGAERTSRPFDFPAWASEALLEFEVLRLDPAPETLILYIDHRPVRAVALWTRPGDALDTPLPVRVRLPLPESGEVTLGLGVEAPGARGEWAVDNLTVEAMR